jgi:hypothetical protein
MPVLSTARPARVKQGPSGISRRSGPLEPRYGMSGARVFWRRHSVPASGTDQSGPTRRNSRSTHPVVWRSAGPHGPFLVSQV